ncbi:hypothetical protein SAMN05443582_1011069 [Phyllobacterium sp. OV277]|nr:hypothetical protein SAMN05443582_1011069 [Phyllobacterium sp. OV277]
MGSGRYRLIFKACGFVVLRVVGSWFDKLTMRERGEATLIA